MNRFARGTNHKITNKPLRLKSWSRCIVNMNWNTARIITMITTAVSTLFYLVFYPFYCVSMKFREKIKLMRAEKGWSQEQVAEKLNMSLNAYGDIERGRTRPNLRRLEQIAKIFGIELEDLVSDRNILNFGGTQSNHYYQNWYDNSSSEQLLKLQHELEKVQLINTQQTEKIELLKQQNKDLRDMIAFLQKNETE